MTRLSEALKRAAETADTEPAATDGIAPPAENVAWQFAPVETMHVPDEPASASPDLRRGRPAFGLQDPAHRQATRAALTPLDPAYERVGGAPTFVADEDGQSASVSTLDGSALTTSDNVPAVEPVSAAATTFRPLAERFGQDRNKLIVGEGLDGALVEQYRHLAAMMHHAQKASNVRSVMVTSALPAEGKTLTATNLALTLSESYQKRVLLIDADLRRPRMQEMFALPSAEGLTDSLALPRDGRLPVQQVSPTLWVLTAGAVLPDPMSLLVSPAMKQLIEDAMDAFDWVVVDTPPIAILPDANLLASMIDTTLLVVSAQSTPYPMVQRAAQAVGTNRILGVVLNRAERAGMPANYSYYGANPYQQGPPKPARRQWFGWLRRRGNAPHVQ